MGRRKSVKSANGATLGFEQTLWQGKRGLAQAETCLSPQFGAPLSADDGEPFEEKMARLTKELSAQFAESKKLEEEIRKNLKGLGFDV